MQMLNSVAFDLSSVDWNMLIIVMVFILLDVLTGCLNAAMHGEFTSSKMREGLMHKCGTVGMLLVCGVCDVAVKNSITDLGIPFGVLDTFGVLIVAMELGSIWENCCKLNPDLAKLPFSSIFGFEKDDKE